MSQKNKHVLTGIICATIGFGIAVVMRKYRGYVFRKLRKLNPNNNANKADILIVNTVHECERVANDILRRCSDYRVLGFDCEWVTKNDKRQPIALMQLAANEDYCALIRLCSMKIVQVRTSSVTSGNCFFSLRGVYEKLLEDASIIKVGVAPSDDAKYLQHDYGFTVRGCLDLRHLTQTRGGFKWHGQTLSRKLSEHQVQYSSQDSLVAVKIFNEIIRPWWQLWGLPKWSKVLQGCQKYIDIKYKSNQNKQRINRIIPQHPNKNATRAYSTRQRPLYDNCLLQAPDGEVLSTCDHNKAQWYVAKNLGQIVETNPLTVRLTFEPSGRAVGEVGKYYTMEKENRCVVCGETKSYIRKNVIPHEYRKYFPSVMKDHMSHDILLLCRNCHLRNNSFDLALRYQLAEECNAPIGSREDAKMFEVPDLKKVRSAARALLSKDVAKIPMERVEELEKIVRSHFDLGEDETISMDMLREANDLIVSEINENYEPHGRRVVSHYIQNGGLMLLEQLWREHFLKSMNPQYLPRLWSVTHNHSRLTQRIEQGRILPEEIRVAGLLQ
ncbi:hypothetical protein L9F63_004740 [Diploptera punctata]|uniref:3'-5' exonuclease domain-containing protein n=1 Tax=Diploptera punctata TaxID=6984 RepID=A0AAD7ZFT9_DIPPU|nr:hypothetical protein L9F63_004740 [Diploptera punctata]